LSPTDPNSKVNSRDESNPDQSCGRRGYLPGAAYSETMSTSEITCPPTRSFEAAEIDGAEFLPSHDCHVVH